MIVKKLTTSHLSSDENNTSFCGQPQNGCPLFYTLKSEKDKMPSKTEKYLILASYLW